MKMERSYFKKITEDLFFDLMKTIHLQHNIHTIKTDSNTWRYEPTGHIYKNNILILKNIKDFQFNVKEEIPDEYYSFFIHFKFQNGTQRNLYYVMPKNHVKDIKSQKGK